MQHDRDDQQPPPPADSRAASQVDSRADMAGSRMPGRWIHEPVPRLPGSKHWTIGTREIVRIAMVAAMLVGVVVMRQPCADGVAKLIGQYDTSSPLDASPPEAPTAEERLPPGTYVEIKGTMTEEEIRKALEQAGVKDVGEAPAAPEPASMPEKPHEPPDERRIAQ